MLISPTKTKSITSVSKPLAIDELNGNMRDGALYIACKATVGELRTFIRQQNGKMHGSPHDDRVMSLAISNQMLKYVWLPEYRVAVAPKKNTFDWWSQHILKAPKPGRQPIGAENVRKVTI